MIKKKQRGRPPGTCVLDRPYRNSIWLCGLWVNLQAIARTQGISCAYVSFIINGEKDARLPYYIKIAGAIGVSLDELVAGIEERKKAKIEQAQIMSTAYHTRISREDTVNAQRKKRGLPPILTLPGLRLPKD